MVGPVSERPDDGIRAALARAGEGGVMHIHLWRLLRRQLYVTRPDEATTPSAVTSMLEAENGKRHCRILRAALLESTGRSVSIERMSLTDCLAVGMAFVADIEKNKERPGDCPEYPEGWQRSRDVVIAVAQAMRRKDGSEDESGVAQEDREGPVRSETGGQGP